MKVKGRRRSHQGKVCDLREMTRVGNSEIFFHTCLSHGLLLTYVGIVLDKKVPVVHPEIQKEPM